MKSMEGVRVWIDGSYLCLYDGIEVRDLLGEEIEPRKFRRISGFLWFKTEWWEYPPASTAWWDKNYFYYVDANGLHRRVSLTVL